MTKISDRLRKVRQDSGLSVRDFAALLTSAGYEVSHGTVSAYENGTTRPLADYIAVICQMFDKNPRWLLLGEGIEEDVPATEAEKLVMQMRQLVRPILPSELKKVDRPRGTAENDG